MDLQNMKQTGLAGEFLASDEPSPPPEQQPGVQAIGVGGRSSAQESENAQKRANLVLAMLFLAGMGVVYFMSMSNDAAPTDAMAAASETIVNDAVRQFQTKPIKVVMPDSEQADKSPVQLAREMITGAPARQVPLKNLKDNPFVLTRGAGADTVAPEKSEPAAVTSGVTPLQRAEALRLQSIVSANNRSLVIISDRLLSVGQEIEGWTVHEIGNGQVTLKRKNLSYVLKTEQ